MRGGLTTVAAASATAVALAVSGCGLLPSTTSVGAVAFARPLPVPPLAESRMVDGVRTFSLTAQAGTAELVGGVETATWGFDGPYLGPTLRAERGEQVAVQVDNQLDETTSVHWHGMQLPAVMDGGPHQEIAPGDTWRPTWEIAQPAATLWYHPHPHGATEEHVYRGLAGLFLLDDDATAGAALPSEYGIDDVPVVVQDKAFDADGELVLRRDGSEPGTLGDTVLTNGTAGAYLDVVTERVRLRLVNGSTARTYAFGFTDRPFDLVATDGGLLDGPVELDRVRLSPGERAEVVVEMSPGETVRLHSFAPDLGRVLLPSTTGGKDSFDVLELRAADELAPSSEPSWEPSRHADADELDPAEASVTRRFELNTRSINGARMDMRRIDEVAVTGDTEVWEVRSTQGVPHNFHVHDVQFRVLSVDGAPPPPELAGRKDTVYLEPHRTYRLLMRFDHADPEVPYMYHCHMLLHEDGGMMGQLLVVDPEDAADTPARVPRPSGHHR